MKARHYLQILFVFGFSLGLLVACGKKKTNSPGATVTNNQDDQSQGSEETETEVEEAIDLREPRGPVFEVVDSPPTSFVVVSDETLDDAPQKSPVVVATKPSNPYIETMKQKFGELSYQNKINKRVITTYNGRLVVRAEDQFAYEVVFESGLAILLVVDYKAKKTKMMSNPVKLYDQIDALHAYRRVLQSTYYSDYEFEFLLVNEDADTPSVSAVTLALEEAKAPRFEFCRSMELQEVYRRTQRGEDIYIDKNWKIRKKRYNRNSVARRQSQYIYACKVRD